MKSRNNYQEYENYNLSKRSLISVGGTIKKHYEISSLEGLVAILKKLNQEKKSYFVFGGATNIIFDDEFIIESSIHINNDSITINDNILTVGASVKLPYLCKYLTSLGYQGFSKISDIPGEIGGGICNNCSAYNQAISDHLIDIQLVTNKGDIIVLNHDQLQFSYHQSLLKKNKIGVIFQARFALIKGDVEYLTKEYLLTHQKRLQTQPQGIKTLGSTFVNPQNYKAYELIAGIEIDQAMFKNVKMNEKHHNFLEIYGKTTKKSILELIAFIIDKVYNKYGIKLELEIEI